MPCELGLTAYEMKRKPRETSNEESRTIQYGLVAPELTCYLCEGPFTRPYTVMECLHRFCFDCVSKYLRIGRKECPRCAVKLPSTRFMRPDVAMDLLLQTLYPAELRPPKSTYRDTLERRIPLIAERRATQGGATLEDDLDPFYVPSPSSSSPTRSKSPTNSKKRAAAKQGTTTPTQGAPNAAKRGRPAKGSKENSPPSKGGEKDITSKEKTKDKERSKDTAGVHPSGHPLPPPPAVIKMAAPMPAKVSQTPFPVMPATNPSLSLALPARNNTLPNTSTPDSSPRKSASPTSNGSAAHSPRAHAMDVTPADSEVATSALKTDIKDAPKEKKKPAPLSPLTTASNAQVAAPITAGLAAQITTSAGSTPVTPLKDISHSTIVTSANTTILPTTKPSLPPQSQVLSSPPSSLSHPSSHSPAIPTQSGATTAQTMKKSRRVSGELVGLTLLPLPSQDPSKKTPALSQPFIIAPTAATVEQLTQLLNSALQASAKASSSSSWKLCTHPSNDDSHASLDALDKAISLDVINKNYFLPQHRDFVLYFFHE